MLLLLKITFEKCRDIGKTRENRISLARWKKKRIIKFCLCRNRRFCLFCWISVICLIAINFKHSVNPIAREFHPVWQMPKVTFSFILDFHQLLRISKISNLFPLWSFSTILKRKSRNQIKYKTYFANAVEISMFSINLIKITISQITTQKEEKEWQLFSYCENC